MNGYQLACGHWQDDMAVREIGSYLHCIKCNVLHALIIGAVWVVAA